jgi:hypothetical protein
MRNRVKLSMMQDLSAYIFINYLFLKLVFTCDDVILKFVYKGIWWISTFCVPYLHHKKKSTYVIEND